MLMELQSCVNWCERERGKDVFLRILALLVCRVEPELTMATFLPKWFLISPVLIASGACSWMIEASSERY